VLYRCSWTHDCLDRMVVIVCHSSVGVQYCTRVLVFPCASEFWPGSVLAEWKCVSLTVSRAALTKVEAVNYSSTYLIAL